MIQAPVRFSLVAALAAAEKIDFRLLRDTLEISDSLLSKHIGSLEEAGYVEVTKGYVGKRPRTWLSITARGRAAFETHFAALKAIASSGAS